MDDVDEDLVDRIVGRYDAKREAKTGEEEDFKERVEAGSGSIRDGEIL